MNHEQLLGGLLAFVIVGVAVFFAWRQRKTMLLLRQQEDLSFEDRRYLASQVRRRLLCSFLMLVFAGLLVGWFSLAGNLETLKPGPGDREGQLTGENRAAVETAVIYLALALLVLFGILVLSAMDVSATVRFGLRHKKQLEADHFAILAKEAERLRQQHPERN